MYSAGDLLRTAISGLTDSEKPIVIELAVAAMEELIRMAQSGEPLWMPTSNINSTEILSEEEYVRNFPRGIGPKPLALKSEASRESAVVIMNHINLVEILMDVVGIIFMVVLFILHCCFFITDFSVLLICSCIDFRTNGPMFLLA